MLARPANRPVYVAIGVNLDGERDVLGLWLGPTGGEGAKQWMTVLTELKRLYASEWGVRVLMRGGRGRSGQVIPPAWRSTRSR